MRLILIFSLLLMPLSALAGEKADLVIIDKQHEKLYLTHNEKIFGVFDIALGANPRGHKQQRGDQRTPEGEYILDYKNEDSRYHLSIRISYPNERDMARAKAQGVDPGDNIFIHGQPNGFGWLGWYKQKSNWTDGCIALRNSDMQAVWDAVDEGTRVRILELN